MNYYDIDLKLFIGGYEKTIVNRVQASSKHEAIVNCFVDEVHSLSEQDVIDLLEGAKSGLGNYDLQDDDLGLRLENVVELIEVPVTINGQDAIALLPDPKWNSTRYFKVL